MKRWSPRLALTLTLTLGASVSAAAPLPPWLTVAASRPGADLKIPPVDGQQLEALRSDRHGYVERLRRHDFEIAADGTVTERAVRARQFLSEEGIREGGTFSLYARSLINKLIVDQAYVLFADGSRQAFDPRHIQIRAESSRDLFSDTQEVSFPFAGLKVGATAVIAFRRVTAARDWPLPWSEILYTQGMVGVEHFELSLRWPPQGKPPQYKTDDPQLACEVKGNLLRCRRTRIPAIAGDPEVASWPDLLPHVVLSAEDSWQNLSRRERALLDAGRVDPEIRALSVRLVKGAPSARGKIERILRFTADEIRYVGFEHGSGSVVPRPPTVTLQRRFGDCKDKVALFLALARAAGIDAFPVLMATEHMDASKLLLPSWKYFDHVVACAIVDEKVVCLDPTDPNLPAGVVSLAVRDSVALPLVAAGSPKPGRLPVSSKDQTLGWPIEVRSENLIECDGSVQETVVRSYHGAGAGSLRGRLRAQTATERKRWLEQSYAGVMGEKVKPTEARVLGIDEPERPLTLTTVTRYPGQSSPKGWTEYAENDHWLTGIGRDFRTDNRHHPMATSGLSLTSEATFSICAPMRPRFMGARLDLRSEFGELSRHYSFQGHQVTVHTQLTLRRQVVPAKKLPDWNRFLDVALAESRIWFSLTAEDEP